MAAGETKSTCLENGTYILQSTLVLGRGDGGVTIRACPGQMPVLAGADPALSSIVALQNVRQVSIAGLTFMNGGGGGALSLVNSKDNVIISNHFVNNINGMILTTGSSNNIVADNEIDNSALNAIVVKDGSDANRFDSNLIDKTGAIGTKGGGLFLHGASKNVISHNLVEHTAGMGIGIENWDSSTINIGNVVEYNVVQDTNTAAGSIDSGAIYLLGRSQVDTRTIVRDNLVNGTGAPHPAHTVAIYLDDLVSGVTVRANIVTGIGSDAIQIHGGQNDTIENNIIDIGSGRASAILFQAAPADTHPTIPMTNNVVSRNIIYSSSKIPVLFVYYGGGSPTVARNLYFNTSGASMRPIGPVKDLQPAFGDPKFANPVRHDYRIGSGSAAASIGFQPIDQSRIGLAPTRDNANVPQD